MEVNTMVCPKCGNPNMVVNVVAEDKKRGCLMVCLWIVLGVMTGGIALLFPLFMKKKSNVNTHYVCACCGYHTEVKTR